MLVISWWEKDHHQDGGRNKQKKVEAAELTWEREREREREREINALSNVFKKTNQNHGNKTIKLDDNVIVWDYNTGPQVEIF